MAAETIIGIKADMKYDSDCVANDWSLCFYHYR